MKVEPYLFFDGHADEAIEFYKKALGAEVTMLFRFKDNPEPETSPPGSDEKVMHANLRIGETMIMVSDGMCSGKTSSFQGFSLSIAAKDEAEAKRLFDAVGAGGQIQMPLGRSFFSPAFGMVADKFGVSWMVVV